MEVFSWVKNFANSKDNKLLKKIASIAYDNRNHLTDKPIKMSEIIDDISIFSYKTEDNNSDNNFSSVLTMPDDKKLFDKSTESFKSTVSSNNIRKSIVINSPSPSKEIMAIKIKIIVPKGTLNNELSETNNLINNICKESSDLEKVCTEQHNFQQNGKRNSTIELEFCKNNGNDLKKTNSRPIMGKNALLAKANAFKSSQNNKYSDSEIIQELVIERFQKILNNYHERSFKRQISKKTCFNQQPEDYEEAWNKPFNNSQDKNKENFLKNSTMENTFDFIDSTDDQNIETDNESSRSNTTIETKTNTSQCNNYPDDETFFETPIEYDSQNFLEVALGEELANYFSTDSQSDAVMNQTFPSTSSKILINEDNSVGTSELSALMSKASSICSTISKKIRSLGSTIKIQDDAEIHNEYVNTFPENPKLSVLIRESAIQHQIMMQTSKALSICCNTKEFIASPEYVEAERILLLATRKREALLNEIRQLEYDNVEEDSNNLGTVEISSLVFQPKQTENKNIVEKTKETKEYSNWFVCILNCGSIVFSTSSIMANCDGSIKFNIPLKFEGLSSDFQIEISIYSLKVKNNMRNYSHESKFHLNQNTKNSCPRPQKLLHIYRDSQKIKSSEIICRLSSFTLWGKATMKIKDLSNNNCLKLFKVPISSTLSDYVTVDVKSSIKITENCKGFLTIGSEFHGCITWNRRWCSLKENELEYWNYPCEENSSTVGSFDLKYCVNSVIAPADRSLCPRSKTLLLEIARVNDTNKRNTLQVAVNTNYTIVRYFLAADNLSEMKIWEKCLNSVVTTLRNWNCMKCELLFQPN